MGRSISCIKGRKDHAGDLVEARGHEYRAELDGLRGIAIAIIIVVHALPTWIPGGSTAVDLFFVISGYLITGILLRDLGASRFSLTRFYTRRIRRIFPALLTVLPVVLLLGWHGLYATEFERLSLQVAGAVGLFSNFLTWRETALYGSPEFPKPLRHLWSLSAEEQFYLLWPIVLFVLYKIARGRVRGIVIGMVSLMLISFAVSLVILGRDRAGAYFLTLPRAWEFMAGGLLAVCELGRSARLSTFSRPRILDLALASAGSIFLLGGAALLNKTLAYPGWFALIPVLGTMMLIGTSDTLVHRFLSNRLLVSLGLLSYPTYLWHLPIFEFTRIGLGARPASPLIFLVATLFTLVLSWLTYHFVERPIRLVQTRTTLTASVLVGVGALVMLVGFWFYANKGWPDRSLNLGTGASATSSTWPFTKNSGCETTFGAKAARPFCFGNSATPSVLLIGDSCANHLVGGLLDEFALMSVGNGAPLEDVDVRVARSSHLWNANAETWEQIKAYLARRRGEVKVVVVAAQWEALAAGAFADDRKRAEDGAITIEARRKEERGLPRLEIMANGLLRTVDIISGFGAKTILVLDMPEIWFYPKNCKREFLPFFEACPLSIARSEVTSRQKLARELLTKIVESRKESVILFDAADSFCDRDTCWLFDPSGAPYYRDLKNFSVEGSRQTGFRLQPVLRGLMDR